MPKIVLDFLNWCLGLAMLVLDYFMFWRNKYGKNRK